MPTKEQMATVAEHIRDVIGRRYIEGDGDMCSCWFQPEGGGRVGMGLFRGVPVGTPEPFADVPYRGKFELLLTYVNWEGFSHSQESHVIQRVIDGKSPDLWMDGIGKEKVSEPDQFKGILAGDSVKKYEKHLDGATERALARMQEKSGGHER